VPEAGAAVMATGIVSAVARSHGFETVSRALLVVTAALWAALGALFAAGLTYDGRRRWREAHQPAALTAVAGTAVLGSRLTLLGWSWAGWALLVVAAVTCVPLAWFVLRGLRAPSTGASFLLVVAPQSVAVLAAEIAVCHRLKWLELAGLAPLGAGILLYPLVATKFRLRELRVAAGDHWVTGGALAITALACGELAHASAHIAGLGGGVYEALRAATVVLWSLTMAWLPVLIVAELRWPRPRYDVRRWATVFPIGMYAAMSFTTAGVAGAPWIGDFARGWTWVALAAWAVVAVGACRAAISARRSPV
jgi:tellurite resistance protein TehA-like permease